MNKSQALVAGGIIGLSPYVAGIASGVMSRQGRTLILIGALITVLCTAGAYFLRKRGKPKYAAQRLMVDPFLYAVEFAMCAVIVKYVFLRGQ
jgi:hypothetical protein